LKLNKQSESESRIEKALVKAVQKAGGLAIKLISPSMAGLPDRLVLMPDSRCFFVELKAPKQKMRPLQIKRAQQLKMLGFEVFCVDNVNDIKELII